MDQVSPRPAYEAPPVNVGKGIALLLGATLVFGVQDAIAKILVQDHSPFQVVMIRYWAFAAFSIWLVMRRAPLSQAFSSRAPMTQIARGLLLLLDIWLFAEAVKTVPLGDLGAIIMIYPLMVTLFAIPILGERVGPFRFTAVLVGFMGTLIVIRPGVVGIEFGTICGLLSAAAYALYLTLTRKVAGVDPVATSMMYVAAVGLVLSSAVGVFFWTDMGLAAAGMAVVLCVTTCAGHGLVMAALHQAPASVLQPFNYFSLPWAITLGFVVFGTMIDFFALIGAVIIVVAGLAVMWRERRKRRAAGTVPH